MNNLENRIIFLIITILCLYLLFTPKGKAFMERFLGVYVNGDNLETPKEGKKFSGEVELPRGLA